MNQSSHAFCKDVSPLDEERWTGRYGPKGLDAGAGAVSAGAAAEADDDWPEE
jgi:hypothetical protein